MRGPVGATSSEGFVVGIRAKKDLNCWFLQNNDATRVVGCDNISDRDVDGRWQHWKTTGGFVSC